MTETLSLHVRIEGRVQGVWFRAWTAREATALGLSGWVRNCPDGSLEAVFSGDNKNVMLMLEKCRSGPPLAEVSNLVDQPCALPGPGFHQLPTA
ncbi:MAG: acylphosphatase [Rhodospirillaceae bacterium]|jgi:acylphosphatase|nr:acylphosphatase [Rhodospirillaceae bacterium]MBT5244840.1 acylphosphatase [Rhodospirillaceae bacterium]MBT5563620.1 acylphosphatase [Rhodospirillaceae bacterium]MBT6241451.1 acylphosphatase [Rhodospirillaceae bacterium]MBT7138846.1 acylphosphatase [Rhodospirillaceae bacterium]